MPWSKQQFIAKAFDCIGLANYIFDLSPEELQSAVNALDAMMAAWNGEGIRLGYPISSSPTTADIAAATNVPDSANLAIYCNLAILLGAEHGKDVPAFVLSAAKHGYSAMLTKAVTPIQVQQPSWLPAGQGNRRSDRRRVFLDRPSDPLATGLDGNIDDLEIT